MSSGKASMCSIREWSSSEDSSDARNEDKILSLPDKRVLVIADGFGGGGEDGRAADVACAAVHQFLSEEAGDLEATLPFEMRSYFSLAGNVLFNALVHANRQILGNNRSRSVHSRQGASVIAAYLDGQAVSLASVGGCSAWFCREGNWASLLTPRSWGRWVEPTRPARTSEERLPLMALGISEDLEPEVVEVRTRPGDRLWLGTWDPQPDQLSFGEGGVYSAKSMGYAQEQSWVMWEF